VSSVEATIERHRAWREARNAKWVIDSFGIVHISLTRGKEATIDAADINKARPFAWHTHKPVRSRTLYAYACVPGTKPRKHIFLHNVILQTEKQVDHKDGNGLNCRRSNLREATESLNAVNKPSTRQGKYRGVYKTGNTWYASIKVNGKQRYLGSFSTASLAAVAYNKAAHSEFGQFAILNAL
jgi:hypothetical protein